jgi:hypothetical protein
MQKNSCMEQIPPTNFRGRGEGGKHEKIEEEE